MQKRSHQGRYFIFLLGLGLLIGLDTSYVGWATEDIHVQSKGSLDVCLGHKDAPVTIVEYSSLNCRHCASFHRTVFPKLKQQYIDTGKVRLIFRHFPINREALDAAVIVASVPEERQYEVVAQVFQNQDKCFGENSLNELSKIAGIPTSECKVCVANQKIQDAVLQQRLIAEQKYKVEGAPTFFVNGQKFSGVLPLEAIDRALASAR